jgi:glutamate 5-kinase
MFNKINLKIVLRRHKKSFIIAVQKIVFPDRSTFNKSDYNQYSNFKNIRDFSTTYPCLIILYAVYRIFCTGNISQCTSGHLFIRSPALGVDALREEPMTSEEKEYQKLFNEYSHVASQILMTKHTIVREKSLHNARNTFNELLRMGVIPIVNENDTVTVDEIKFGDNDTLAALVSCLVSADLCVTLSDIDGLYTANPHEDPTAEFVPVVHKIDAKIIASAGDSSTSVGTGGMITKIRASRILMTAGIQSVICSGEEPDALVRLARGESVGTLFDPPAERLDIAPRKLWIALGDKAHGSVTVDDGAAKALVSRGSSLLAVGIREVDGQFAEGDVLDVCDPSGMVVARGIAEADSDVLELAAGRRQDQIASNRLLANLAEKPAIHRDNLIVFA